MKVPFRSANVIPLIGLFAFAPAGAQGVQESQRMQARSVKPASTDMVYRLFVPQNHTPSQKYPIVVALHGIGERGNDNRFQVDRVDLAHPRIKDSIQARVPHFIMLPHALPPSPGEEWAAREPIACCRGNPDISPAPQVGALGPPLYSAPRTIRRVAEKPSACMRKMLMPAGTVLGAKAKVCLPAANSAPANSAISVPRTE